MDMIKPIAAAVMGLSIGLGGTAAMAKGHDQGAADGTRNDPSGLRGGVVASHATPGVGFASFEPSSCFEAAFCGVADSTNPDVNYGQNIVQIQVANDARRVKPVVGNGANSR
jgi:hypothetical protein